MKIFTLTAYTLFFQLRNSQDSLYTSKTNGLPAYFAGAGAYYHTAQGLKRY